MSKSIPPTRPARVMSLANVTTRSMSARLAKQSDDALLLGLPELHLEPQKTVKQEPGLDTQPQEVKLKEDGAKFLLFPKLPLELRLMIWRFYAPSNPPGQVIEVFKTPRNPHKDIPGPPTYFTNVIPHPMLNICLETRAEAMRQESWCALEDNVKSPIMFRPLIDAIFYRFWYYEENHVYPGLDRIRHLIVHDIQVADRIAKFPFLEELTIIPHRFDRGWQPYRINLLDDGKPEPRVEFYRPRNHDMFAYCTLRSQLVEMEHHKATSHPLWKLPKLNVMRIMMGGKICCPPESYPTRWDRQSRYALLQLQESKDFWDENSVQSPQ
ncbi:hypothetical protein VTL71DRAFT_11486 [Oculimacula yallundae]|uniref:2EXR domain-containing protein n=1 Tax=Oculimacula yallundae TaxID=86028 RepID=A0ABR4CS09_9HELO